MKLIFRWWHKHHYDVTEEQIRMHLWADAVMQSQQTANRVK